MTRVAWGSNNNFQLAAGWKDESELSPVTSAVLTPAVAKLLPSYYFDAALMGDGSVSALGGNESGEIGDGTHVTKPFLTRVADLSVADIAIGGTVVIVRLPDGTIRTWGGNAFGQLGTGVPGGGQMGTGSPIPVRPNEAGIVGVFAGASNCAATRDDGMLVVWGENKSGQLGNGKVSLESPTPTLVPGLTNVKAVAIGSISSLGGHMLALLGDGTVMAWGANGHGQLGDGTTTNSANPHRVLGLANVVAVAAGISHSLALLSDGRLMGWGSNLYGELGLGSAGGSLVPTLVMSDVDEVSAGFRYTLVRTDTVALGFGWNRWGVLGDGTQIDKHLPTQILALGEGVVGVEAGEYHSTAEIGGPGPAPVLTVLSERGGVLVEWAYPGASGMENWTLKTRPVTPGAKREFSPKINAPQGLPPATRDYLVSGLEAGQAYEVLVENHTYGRRIGVGTPS